MATIEIAAGYVAFAMNAENNLNQAQRDGYQAISGKILKDIISQRMVDRNEDRLTVATYTVDELFLLARKKINQWDIENGRKPRYDNV